MQSLKAIEADCLRPGAAAVLLERVVQLLMLPCCLIMPAGQCVVASPNVGCMLMGWILDGFQELEKGCSGNLSHAQL
jgi:hypothetical protein